jgi:hypothetical protein
MNVKAYVALDSNCCDPWLTLVALGWACQETSGECDSCPEKSNCGNWEGEDEF